MNFRKKKGGHTNPKNLVADFSTSRKRGGGGQRPFGSFPKIHPKWSTQSSLSLVNHHCTALVIVMSVFCIPLTSLTSHLIVS